MSGLLTAAMLLTAIGCGLVAGVFFAFSSFVMPALKRLEPEQGIAAMQSINRLAVTPAFMTALFGTAAACLGLAVWAIFALGERPVVLVLVGGLFYVVGTIGVTIARNVPLNDGLEELRPQDVGAAGLWDEYVMKWTRWNHLRTGASLAAAVVFSVAVSIG